MEIDAITAEIADKCHATQARRLDRALTRLYNDALRPWGVTAPQLAMLVAIHRLHPVRAHELARVLEMEKSTVSRNVVRLRSSGWVEGAQSARADSGLELTEAGRRLVADVYPVWLGVQGRVESVR